ncbi:MAG TPA: acetyl-CoA hydrolase/transferase C-terminal domain-containing protein [Dokdonella sp.]|uniref:acetyl-CoA hydrolase/transferase C-terminal domain-containing protein n=1 Tax=Dokdonella sp. TaxID=2291710 RepID=UPI002D7F4A54|nr:acetyl-CoA hydrolase/transferase C-terminal domain-containing protein [Dokdonella sp.]HET9032710.1 acetyl-CoA hydrolase/transferase C-terminal domain-containing protein [Dokdonella sp.]
MLPQTHDDRTTPMTSQCADINECVERILESCGEHVVLAVPLGLGKPNRLINALYRRIAADPARRLTIHTALSLAVPKASSDLERRFAGPFLQRQFGDDYPDLDYVEAMRTDSLPHNVRVHEFYFQSGSMLGSRQAQRAYVSLNYTAVARDLVRADINVIAQLVARRGEGADSRYSLACNPDVTLDLLDRIREADAKRPLFVGVVHDELPFLSGDADVGAGEELFDIVLDTPALSQRLFALPREDVDDAEYAIGLHASTLVKDGGTLQIGIGALSDALVQALILRHKQNPDYRRTIESLRQGLAGSSGGDVAGGQDVLDLGLHGSSEMIMDGFMHLRRNGVLTRKVYANSALQDALNDDVLGETLVRGDAHRLRAARVIPAVLDSGTLAELVELGIVSGDVRLSGGQLIFADGSGIPNNLDDEAAIQALDEKIQGRKLRGGCYLQGGFCLGSSEFYDWLTSLEGDDYTGLAMNRISEVNRLQRGEESLGIAQRRDARFFNTCMIATALGAAASDAIEDGRVVSGVGGQFNFVAMAHSLDDARSILMLRSTRKAHGEASSNIRWNYGHTTIPRHLRDIYVTEYGIADLRGKSDEECVLAMIAISDARFHRELVDAAIQARKLPSNFSIPVQWAENTAARLHARLNPARAQGLLPDYPFGSDFNAVELRLLPALSWLKASVARPRRWVQLLSAILAPGAIDREALQRLDLERPQSVKEHVMARLISGALNRSR